MTAPDLIETLTDERLAPLLPLVDAVWDNGTPSDIEIAAVCMAVLRIQGIDLTCKEALRHWLDPENPPSSQDLAALHAHVTASLASVA